MRGSHWDRRIDANDGDIAGSERGHVGAPLLAGIQPAALAGSAAPSNAIRRGCPTAFPINSFLTTTPVEYSQQAAMASLLAAIQNRPPSWPGSNHATRPGNLGEPRARLSARLMLDASSAQGFSRVGPNSQVFNRGVRKSGAFADKRSQGPSFLRHTCVTWMLQDGFRRPKSGAISARQNLCARALC